MTTAGDLVDRYLADPTPATLADVRRAVRATPGFDPGLVVSEVDGLAALQRLMPGALLSPSAHGALAQSLARAGRQQAADRERLIAAAALAGILATGDGSRERPWSVLRVGDEYDVLRSRRRRSTEQSLERDGSRYLDRHVCDDGSEAWFDVTELFPPER